MMRKAKKIALIGPESTGKSTLSVQLAGALNCPWVEEYARTYIDQLDRPYNEADLLTIAQKQVALEAEVERSADNYLILDTTITVVRIWSEHKYGLCDPWILDAEKKSQYDLYLVCDIDLPWQEDRQREHPKLRKYFLDQYVAFVENHPPFELISGFGHQRLQNALDAIMKHNI